MLFLKLHPIPSRINLRRVLLFYCLLSFTTTGCCDAGSVIRNNFFYLAVTEDNIETTNKTGITLKDMMSDGKMNATNISSPDDEVGGGSVNEKEREYQPKSHHEDASSDRHSNNSDKNSEPAYNPSNHRSHLLHALEGLHRYPNYLSRWDNDDVEALEEELQRVLRQVQEQKSNTQDQRDNIQHALGDFFLENPEWKEFSAPPESWDELREILDTRAAQVVFRSKKIRKMTEKIAMNEVIAGRVEIELDPGHLEEWMDEEMFDVYSFPLLSKTFCQKLCLYASSVLSYVEASRERTNKPGRSCYRDLDNLGLGWLNDLVFHLILKPISAKLYRDTELEGGDLDYRHGFIAAYSGSPTTSKPRQRLVPHTDDAEVSVYQ